MEDAKLKDIADDMERQTLVFNKRLESLAAVREKLRVAQEKALSCSLKNSRKPSTSHAEALQDALNTLDESKDSLITQQLDTLQDSLNLLKVKDSFINYIAELSKKASQSSDSSMPSRPSEAKVEEME